MIVRSKLSIPYARNELIPRTELLRVLDEGMTVKLTLLSAPAGYGKTTVLSEWARLQGDSVIWVSLDSQDDSWTVFWEYLLAALQQKMPEFGHSVRPILDNGPSASALSPQPLVSALLNELLLISHSITIIFDDFHFISTPAIHKSMSYLLQHLPSHVHLYIASRTELALPTARMMAQGEMRHLTMHHLRLGLEEGQAFLCNSTRLALSSEQVAVLYGQTEGWISGLQLAAISLRSSRNIAETIQQFSGHQSHIAAYLLEEVFRNQDEGLREFLLSTSILSRMNHALCHVVTGQPNCQQQLERLMQLNLFIIPLDEHQYWFRYHHLLSDFLQQQLERTEPVQKREAHVRAAGWLEAQGLYEEAGEHYLAGQQYEDVVRIIETHLFELIYKKSAVLGKWILQVPEKCLEERPMVLILYLQLMVGNRRWKTLDGKVSAAIERWKAQQHKMVVTQWREIMGNLYFLKASSSYINKDLQQCNLYFDLSDEYLSEQSLFQLMGRNKHHGLEEFDDHSGYINHYHELSDFLTYRLQQWGHMKNHPYASSMRASQSKLLYEWNRLKEAEACIQGLMDEVKSDPIPRILLQIYISASRIQQALDRPDEAIELLDQLTMRIDSPDYEAYMRKIGGERASLLIRQGRVDEASRWLEHCGMSHLDDLSLECVFEYLALARVLSACDRTEEALLLLERLYLLLVKEDRLRDCNLTLIMQSVTLYRIGQKERAFERLEKALRMAQHAGFIRSFIDEGPVMVDLLTEYTSGHEQGHHRIRPGMMLNYAMILLQALDRGSGTPRQEELPATAKVYCFGRFSVQSGEQEMRWRTSKTRELMAYLVHHQGEQVDKHRILEDLWGELDGDRAGTHLNTTLHFLRKGLQAIGLDDMIRYSNGYYKLDMLRLPCDYSSFRALAEQGAPEDIQRLEGYALELGALYKSGYLDGSSYPWATAAQRRLESQYIERLLQVQERYAQQRNYSSAQRVLKQALACDPLQEEVHVKLIEMYVAADERAAAIKQYEELRSILDAEFGIPPRAELAALLQFRE